MTRDDIIRMAREAGWTGPEDNLVYVSMLQRFFALAAAAEREECARVCESLIPFGPELALQKATAEDCAAAIRARGEK